MSIDRGALAELCEQRAAVHADCEAVLDRADERGTLTKRDQEILDRLDRKFRSLTEQIDAANRELGIDPTVSVRSAARFTGEVAVKTGQVRNGGHSGGDLRSLALNVNEGAERMPDEARQNVAVTLESDSDPESRLARYVIATGDENYFGAFRKWFRDPQSGQYEWTPEEREAYIRVQSESRAMGLSTGGGGGFLVPYELDPQILISSAGSVDPVREVARVTQTAYNEKRLVTSLGVTSSWDPEAQEVSDDSPALLQPAITCFKGQAFVPVSFELFEDSDIAQQVAKLLLDSKAQLEASAFTLGTGTGQPKGLITAVSAVAGSVVTASGGALALADITANQNALPPRWRANAKWMANLSIINAARQLPKGSGLTDSLVDDSTTPPKMLGWQVHENSNVDGTIAAGATNDYVLLSGDFQQYVIADRVGTTIEYVPHLFGSNQRPTGQRGFLMHWRTGGDVVIPDAFRLTNYNG